MRRASGGFYEEKILLPLGSRAAAVNGPNFSLGRARGILWTLYIKTAGLSTLTFRVNSITMLEGLAQQVSTNVVFNPGSEGTYLFHHHPFGAPQPAGEAAVTINTAVVKQVVGIGSPGTMRVGIAKGDTASAWVYGVSARRVR